MAIKITTVVYLFVEQ